MKFENYNLIFLLMVILSSVIWVYSVTSSWGMVLLAVWICLTTWFLISYAIDVFLSTKKDKILVSKDSKL